MNNYKVKEGIELPVKKYFPGYGLCTITAETTDAQVAAIIATGHGSIFEPVHVAAPEIEETATSPEADIETNNIKPTKKDGKARKSNVAS